MIHEIRSAKMSFQDIQEVYSFTSAKDVFYWQIYSTDTFGEDDQKKGCRNVSKYH